MARFLRQPINLFYLVTVLASFDRSLSIIVMAWVTLVVTKDVAAVGQIFVIGQSFNILFGPGIGSVIDRLKRRHAAIIGQSIIALGALVPILYWLMDWPLTFAALVGVAVVTATGNLMNLGALDGLLQQLVAVEDRRHVSAIANGLRQGAMVAGVGLGGFILEAVDGTGAFAILMLTALLVVGGIYFLPPPAGAPTRAKGYGTYISDIQDGFRYSLRTGDLMSLGIITALAFSAGYLSNVLLPALVFEEIGGGSGLYGVIDAAWSVGGIASAFAVSVYLRKYHARHFEAIFLGVLGLCMATAAFMDHPPSLIFIYLVMGAAFSICKVLCDGLLLQSCAEEYIGRVRSNIQILTSAFGVAMYLSPTVFASAGVRDMYLGWGCILAFTGLTFFFFRALLRRRYQPS